ncbi:MAG: hypothetical protein JWN38_105 [Candidatus Saccharibacteria bacterium]|nr:hypothetical protein [Candidatus Saccharibacteria bacterium]
MNAFMAQGARIIAFRGAGTVNGIDPAAAQRSTEMIVNYLSQSIEDGTPVVLMFDGDEDNRAKPDIGSVFGSVVDSLADKPNVFAIAAQTKGWYYPKTEGANLETATGTPIDTYVFDGHDLNGKDLVHDDFTQSAALAGYKGYEQVFVGPAGPIAFNQLRDISDKTVVNRPAETGPLTVTVIETPNNGALDATLQEQLSAAQDDEARAKIQAKITQRSELPYGALYTSAGEFSVDTTQYSGLAFQVTSALAK